METVSASAISLDRMVRAVEKVRERLLRATSALERGGIPYAVVGGNAVAAWVSAVDEAAVRFTQDVDILIRREDLPAVTEVLEAAGFKYRHSAGIDMFLDGEKAKARDAVHVLFAGEKVHRDDLVAAPALEESTAAPHFKMVTLEALVRMKLTSYRRKDQVHLQDMIGVGLIEESWCQRLPRELAERLRELLDDPDG
jgi:hypothetical protein